MNSSHNKENAALLYQQGSGIKISCQIDPFATDEDLWLLRQLGVDHCYCWMEPEQVDVAFITRLRQRCEAFGLTLYNIGVAEYGKSADIQLGLENCEEHTRQFCRLLETLGQAGVHTTTITWEANCAWCTTSDGEVGRELFLPAGRGGALTRVCDTRLLPGLAPSHGRRYAREEVWGHFKRFVRRVIPVAEQSGVRIALHPNDPPVPSSAGIDTLIQSAEDYRRAFALAGSDFFGMELCLGCWLEGGEGAFGSLGEAIPEFVRQGKVFIVHFRNVSSPAPYFVETFLDDGYADMYEVMKLFAQAGYNGTLSYDHVPQIVGQGQAGGAISAAYAIGYMKALVRAAENET